MDRKDKWGKMIYVLLFVFISLLAFTFFILFTADKMQEEYDLKDLSKHEEIEEKSREIKNIRNEIQKLNRFCKSKKEIKETLIFPKINILDEKD